MHPARAKAKQTQALVETAASVETINARLDAIEAGQAEILEAVRALAESASKPKGANRG